MTIRESLEKLKLLEQNIKDDILCNSGESYSCTSSCTTVPHLQVV